ncbi:MAG TPA: hypothetical protein VE988_00410 [Gemmataceae bacterium]|nr:hypothetical protein [Gemmataceae bacterium]
MVRNMLSFGCFLLVMPLSAGGPQQGAKQGLPPEVEKAVREAVYSGKLLLAHPVDGKYALMEIVLVPEKVESAYKDHPDATIELLLAITEGGRPTDSMIAASFAIALGKSPAVASVVLSVFKEDAYDAVDKDWKVTPRQHWLGKLKEMMIKSKAKK